jgi:hypothetical protein
VFKFGEHTKHLEHRLPTKRRRQRPPPVLTSPKPLSTLNDGSLARASLNYAVGIMSRLSATITAIALTTAACGGLRSAPYCRRTYLRFSYSYAAPFGPALLVTQDPKRTYAFSDHVRRLRAEFLI